MQVAGGVILASPFRVTHVSFLFQLLIATHLGVQCETGRKPQMRGAGRAFTTEAVDPIGTFKRGTARQKIRFYKP